MKSRRWERPRLVVLVRGDSEEYVLVGCKSTQSNVGPSISDQGCGNPAANNCTVCSPRAGGAS